MKTIYLCGGINALSDKDATDWREAVKTVLAGRFNFLDPMRRGYRGKEDLCYEEIVLGDIRDIEQSDILLVNGIRPSWGTAMEVFFAADLYIPRQIITVCPAESPSPWLRYHSDYLVKSFDDAFKVLLRYQ